MLSENSEKPAVTLRQIGTEVDFLVTKQMWRGGLKEALLEHTSPNRHKLIQEIDGVLFEDQSPPAFLDQVSMSYRRLGDIRWPGHYSNEVKSKIWGRLSAMVWQPNNFVLQVAFETRMITESLDSISSDEWSGIFDFAKSLVPAQVPLVCYWEFYVDEQLRNVKDSERLNEWVSNTKRRLPGHYFTSLTSTSSPSVTVLRIELSKPVHYQGIISEIPSSKLERFSVSAHFAAEIDAAIKYNVTMLNFDKVKQRAQQNIAKARSTGSQSDLPVANVGIVPLVASLHPGYSDNLVELERRIEQINRYIMALHDDGQLVKYLFSIFEPKAFWRDGKVALSKIGYEMAHLVSMDRESDVNSLTLPAYYRRSGRNIREFYLQRFNDSSEQLEKLLQNWRVASSIRMEQQTAELNRLVLLLTIISAILATLQVLVAIRGWNKPEVLGVSSAILVLIVIALVVFAYRRVQHVER